MDLKRLPFLPLHFFYFQFSRHNQRWFTLLMALLLAAAGFTLFSYHNPTFWSLEVEEIAATEVLPAKVLEVDHNYRTLDLILNAFTQKVSYSAGLLQPHVVPTLLFWGFQLLGWAIFLAAASYIRSRWIYLFYFVFALFIYFTGGVQSLFPGLDDLTYRILGGVVAIPFLGLAYLFQMHILRMRFGGRMLSILTLLILYYGYAFIQGGWTALHEMSADGFLLYAMLTLPWAFFLGKDITNLLMAGATNRRDPRARLHIGVILGLSLALLATEFFMLNEYLGFPWLPRGLGIGLRPIHLLLLAAVATIFTSQNHFNQVKDLLSSNLVFTYLLISWGIIALSHLALIFSQGDFTYLDTVDRFAAISFFFVGLGHLFFIFFNHRFLLQDKVNVYFLLTQGPVFRFAVVWIIGLIGLITLEGRTHWASINRFYHSMAVQKSDQAFMKGDIARAAADLELATALILNSVKGHYNLGALRFALDPSRPNDALRHYQEVAQFPYATLKGANLLWLAEKPVAARELLSRQAQKSRNPYLSNNLGILYAEAGKADSAITYLKKALQEDLGLSSVYSNLALLYLDYEKPGTALEFFESSLDLRHPSAAAFTNALAMQLAERLALEVPPVSPEAYEDYAFQYNLLLTWVKAGKADEASQRLARKLTQENRSGEAMILDAYLMFTADSVDLAASRIAYVEELFPREVAKAYYTLGLAYFERDVPEMARLYFEKAGHEGDPKGLLAGATMDLDLRRLDTAQAKLSRLRVNHEALWQEASKELAMLLLAYNQQVFAQTEYDISRLDHDDWIRVGRYADSVDQYIPALEAFRRALQLDSTDVSPYLEMGKIFNRYGDTRAGENLRYGLEIDPGNTALSAELARTQLYQGNVEEARTLLNQMGDTVTLEAALVEAEIKLASQDTAAAMELLLAIHQADPLNQEAVLALARLYRDREDFTAGNTLISRALDLNTENAGFWYYYAVFSNAWNQPKDAGYGALRAIQLSPSAEEKRQIQREFNEEILKVIR